MMVCGCQELSLETVAVTADAAIRSLKERSRDAFRFFDASVAAQCATAHKVQAKIAGETVDRNVYTDETAWARHRT